MKREDKLGVYCYENGEDSDYENITVNVLKFPGGEVHVTVPTPLGMDVPGTVEVYAYLQNSDDVMALMLTTDAVRRMFGNTPKYVLTMPYIPYARQDRVANPGEALSLKVFCNMINSLNYDVVTVHDPHSDVASALINNIHVVEQTSFVSAAMRGILDGGAFLCSPDAGARKKTLKFAKAVSPNFNRIIFADKVRDTKTGRITGMKCEFSESHVIINPNVLVVDDICDGGATFIELAKALKLYGPGKRYLYVTHGIFSKGVEPLLEHYDLIFTPHCWVETNDERIRLV